MAATCRDRRGLYGAQMNRCYMAGWCDVRSGDGAAPISRLVFTECGNFIVNISPNKRNQVHGVCDGLNIHIHQYNVFFIDDRMRH